MRWTTLGILFGIWAGFTPINAATKEDLEPMNFQIRDPATREVYFHGYEKVSEQGSEIRKETHFLDPQHKELLVEDAAYDRTTLRMDSYVSRNALTGEETVLKTDGKRIDIRYRPDATARFRETTLSWSPETFHGKVFDDLIVRNWESLMQGSSLKFDLVLPFRLESRGFQIRHDRRVSLDGQSLEVFALQPQNFILRAFVPRMEFLYSANPKPRLEIFSGPSMLPIRGETNRPVEIVYGTSGARS